MVDRVINVPLSNEQVIKSVKTLPRSLEEGFVVPIQFKRMKGVKNSVAEAFVSPKGLVKALETLKTLRNPFYKDINIDFEYPKKSQEKHLTSKVTPQNQMKMSVKMKRKTQSRGFK